MIIDRAACIDCGICTQSCWYDALTLYGTWYTPEMLMPKLLREKPYMDRSGGGVTIGGGEATCWPEFCLELIRLCHESGISVAIDTCGYPTKPDSVRVLEVADLILFDLKGMIPDRHMANTGVSNEPILQTFSHLTHIGKPVIVRIPLIPGYNDSSEELDLLISLLSRCPNVKRVDLMFYHEYGRTKYTELGLQYPLGNNITPYTPLERENLLRRFRTCGIPVQDGG